MSDDLLPQPATILFTIPVEVVAPYRAWKAEADLIYLRKELERRGSATILRFEDESPSFDDLTALPALEDLVRGEFEPVYGTAGGGYPFKFQPHRTGCELIVTSPMPVEPFHADLAAPQVLNEVLPTPARNGIFRDCPREAATDWRFAITGPSFEKLLHWGWDAVVVGAYSYEFVPTNIGCPIFITHEASGARLDLGMEDFE